MTARIFHTLFTQYKLQFLFNLQCFTTIRSSPVSQAGPRENATSEHDLVENISGASRTIFKRESTGAKPVLHFEFNEDK